MIGRDRLFELLRTEGMLITKLKEVYGHYGLQTLDAEIS